jgi:hypothetical protein
MSNAIDRLTESAGKQLIGEQSRRGFFGRVGGGVAALGAAKLFGAPAARAAARCGITGCWDTGDVDVCYTPWVTNKNAAIRSGPGAGYRQIATIEQGKHWGRQSTRNPSCLQNPGPQVSENNYIWGYNITGTSSPGTSGWISLADVAPDTGWVGSACGPAGAGFDCRDGRCGAHCTAPATGSASSISGTRSIGPTEATLRYAPGSTAFRYVLSGDSVTLRCRVGSWTCVSVNSGNSAGSIGWVLNTALA